MADLSSAQAPSSSAGDSAKKVIVRNLGCKSNFADGVNMLDAFSARGLIPVVDEGAGDGLDVAVCVVNSCSVTEDADRESRREVRRLKKRYPHARVVFTGCGAEIRPEEIAADLVVGNKQKPRLVERALGLHEDPSDAAWPLPTTAVASPALAGRTRAFLKVQEGCERFCTYCIIPYGRGPNRALGVGEILDMLRRTRDLGTPEAVLTGTNLGNLGLEAMAELCNRIEREFAAPFRVRLSSLDPKELSDAVIHALGQGSVLCPHVHLALQSPHGGTLRRMKRGYGRAEVERSFSTLGIYPDLFIGMDVITGFAGETDADFSESVAMLEGLPWSRLHVFPYSERAGTPATRLPGLVPVSVRKERARRLTELSLARQLEWTSRFVGRVIPQVLLEAETRGPDGSREWLSGYSRNYLRVLVRKQLALSEGVVCDVVARDTVVDPVRQEVSVLGGSTDEGFFRSSQLNDESRYLDAPSATLGG